MDKEKELDQMRNTLDSYLKRNPIGYIENIPLFICSVLIEDGYRKADEVRKETIKEIWERVSNVEGAATESAISYSMKIVAEFERIFAECSVEVEE